MLGEGKVRSRSDTEIDSTLSGRTFWKCHFLAAVIVLTISKGYILGVKVP